VTTVQSPARQASRRWSSLGDVYVPPAQAPSHRSFGITVGSALALIAIVSAWRGHAVRAEALAAVAVALAVTALVRPTLLAAPARAWMAVGHALGWFNSRVLLTVMFFVVLWPIGALARLFGNDPLERRRRGSGWVEYPQRLRDPKHFERLS
jgi:hypothetical protein